MKNFSQKSIIFPYLADFSHVVHKSWCIFSGKGCVYKNMNFYDLISTIDNIHKKNTLQHCPVSNAPTFVKEMTKIS